MIDANSNEYPYQEGLTKMILLLVISFRPDSPFVFFLVYSHWSRKERNSLMALGQEDPDSPHMSAITDDLL